MPLPARPAQQRMLDAGFDFTEVKPPGATARAEARPNPPAWAMGVPARPRQAMKGRVPATLGRLRQPSARACSRGVTGSQAWSAKRSCW